MFRQEKSTAELEKGVLMIYQSAVKDLERWQFGRSWCWV